MASDKLPKELERVRNKVHHLQKVASEPAMGHAELDELEEKVTLQYMLYLGFSSDLTHVQLLQGVDHVAIYSFIERFEK